jgi:DNA-binding response OmpR family regulator
MKRILILDDNADILEVITIILDSGGFQVQGIQNGHDLLSVITSFSPDLIMLDIMLGDLDGRDLCNLLKHNEYTMFIPIIMISASYGIRNLSDKNCEPDDFISKPFDIDDLLQKVNALLS